MCSSRARAQTRSGAHRRGIRRLVGRSAAGSQPEAARPGAVLGVPGSGRTGWFEWPSAYTGAKASREASRYTGVAIPPVCPEFGADPADRVARDTRPVTMARRDSAWRAGSDGGARIAAGSRGRPARPQSSPRSMPVGGAGRERPLAGPGRLVDRPGIRSRDGHQGGQPHRDAPTAAHRRRAPRRPSRGPRRGRRGPAGAPVRRVPRQPWTSRSPRRSTCSSSPATCSTRTSSPSARWSAWPRELGRLAKARIRSVLVPGTHDVYDRSSVYRAYDLAALAGTRPAEDELIVVLTPDHPWIHLQALDAVVHGPCFPTKRAPHSPLRDLAARRGARRRPGSIGVLHAAVAIPGRTDGDEVVVTVEEIAASGLDYLALGHWHCAQVGEDARASRTPTRARPSRSPSTRTRPARCCS